jgi:ATP-dependent Clp protease ATP-binding subunit ClpA
VRGTARLKRTLELARAEARRFGHRCADTEHGLLGIARLDDGVAAYLLGDRGAPPARIREEVAPPG